MSAYSQPRRNGLATACLVWLAWLGVALLFRFGPASLASSFSSLMQESAGLVLNVLPSPQPSSSPSSTKASLGQLQAENRELKLALASVQLERDRLLESGAVVEHRPASPLLNIDALPARIIGAQGAVAGDQTSLLVALGERDGLVGEELVLKGDGLLIDQGSETGIDPDRLVVAGKALLGRTEEVGRWTSRVQPVTDAEFRIGVRLIRPSPLGPVQGARGILSGTGDGCELCDVPATEAIAIGDLVFTDALVSPGGEPIYCGQVATAAVEPTSSHWTITVTPLLSPQEIPSRVEVLRSEWSEERMTFGESGSQRR